ncbi:MAG: delta-60 repeat domain-containing protein, partial [Dokdonella sp.]
MTLYTRVLGFLAGPYLLLALAWMPGVNYAQNANDGFDPNANNPIYALAVQADGKILVGGDFTTIAGQARNRLARLNADGSVDADFAVTDVDSTVESIAVQADGRIVIGGAFAQVGTSLLNHIARLNADGSVDVTFDPNADGTVNTLAVQPDGKLVVGGGFTTLAPNGGTAITRQYVARLNVDGSVDLTFDPNANNFVAALALQPDGKLVVGGDFTSLSPNSGTAIPRNRIARLNADGSVDTTFDPNANGTVTALALQPDGKLVVGGTFTTLSPNSGGAIMRNRIARLNVDGSVDMTFDPSANSSVVALALQPDGKLVLGGFFTSLSPNGGGALTRNHIARLNADGSVDTAFDPNA